MGILSGTTGWPTVSPIVEAMVVREGEGDKLQDAGRGRRQPEVQRRWCVRAFAHHQTSWTWRVVRGHATTMRPPAHQHQRPSRP